MARYSALFDTSKSGIISFTASNDAEAIEIYEGLLTGDIYPEDMDDCQEQTEESSSTFYELRNGQGKLIAE
jgi:hypothetical protein